MKLIKQNDSAGGLIFKQNTNGKAMKQNYNFGKGFKIYTPEFNCSVNIDEYISSDQPFTILFYLKEKFTSGSNIAFFREGTSTGTSGKFGFAGNRYFYGGGFMTANVLSLGMFAMVGDGAFVNVLQGTTGLSGNHPQVSFEGLNLFNTALNIYGYMVSDVMIYDRSLSIQELNYLSNNRLGNEPLSTLNLRLHLKLDTAEIINIASIDAVAFRDFSGNGLHKKILGLPVGTLEEQRDSVNQFILEKW